MNKSHRLACQKIKKSLWTTRLKKEGFAGNGFTYFSEHPQGLIKHLDGSKVYVNQISNEALSFSKALVVSPDNFDDVEKWFGDRLDSHLGFNTKSHFDAVIELIASEGIDAVVIDGFRKLPSSLYKRKYLNRSSPIGIFVWDSVLVPIVID